MFKNYFVTGWRNLRKNRLFSAINIFGLSVGLALSFIIFLYVQDELSYDRYNKNAPNIARIIFNANLNGGKITESAVMAPVATVMKKEFPEVLESTRLVNYGSSKITYNDKIFKDDKVALVDYSFPDVFTLKFLEGDEKTALREPNTIIITRTTALKYFG